MDITALAWEGAVTVGAWPADPETTLALNHTGRFDWDLRRSKLYLDDPALAVFDLRPGEFDGDPGSLSPRVDDDEAERLAAILAQALREGRRSYGAYFRIRCRDGSSRWTHTQGSIQREPDGTPFRVIGIVRDATEELQQPEADGAAAEADRSRPDVVEETTAALAQARTVPEVIAALESSRGLGRLGPVRVVLGMLEGGRVRLVTGGVGPDAPELDHSRLEDDLPLNETVRTLTARWISSRREFALRYPRIWPHVESMGVTSGAYLPLVAQGRAIGALGLLYGDRSGFTTAERTLLTALTSGIAQSLQRATMFEEEHELAEGLQRAMLPHSLPKTPGIHAAVRYRSAGQGRDIGGDWYDVIPLPGGRVAAVVGDVQGHDTHAAAVMGQVRIVLRAYAAEGHPAQTVMARASAFLKDLDTDRFATCLYAEADPSTGWLRLVRAGHLSPLLRRPDGTCRPFPVLGGLPLGLATEFDADEYPVTSLELDAQETLLLFTDGLVERPGGDLDREVRAFADTVRHGPADPSALADHLVDAPRGWDGEDDMALVILRREPTPGQQLGRRLHQQVAPGDPGDLVAVREMVRSAASGWGAAQRLDDVALVTDELVANALLHTGGGATVTARALGGTQRHRVRIEVTDTSSSLPVRMAPTDAAVSGRGLLLVDGLADLWGVESRGTGKTVWCEFLAD